MEAQFVDQFEAIARDELDSARIMLEKRKWKQAHYHAGVAVETALKARIMRHERMNVWPSRSTRPELYTHNLERLLRLCGLEASFDEALLSEDCPEYVAAWMIVKDWHINMRYHVVEAFPQALSEDVVNAADNSGLVLWLLN